MKFGAVWGDAVWEEDKSLAVFGWGHAVIEEEEGWEMKDGSAGGRHVARVLGD